MHSESTAVTFEAEHFESVARSYAAIGTWPRVAEVCRRGIAESGDVGRLWELLGRAEWETGNPIEGRKALETASALVPLGVEAQLALAECYVAAGQDSFACMMLGHLARRGIAPARLLHRIGDRLFQIGDFRRAANL